MKKFLSVIATLVVLVSVYPVVTNAAESAPKVVINGEVQSYDEDPIVENGRTLVPLRGIFEALGATVDYDSGVELITANYGEREVKMFINERTAYVDDVKVGLEVPSKVTKNYRTLVPIRFIGESLGALVNWDGATNTIQISSGNIPQSTAALVRGISLGMSMEEVATVEGRQPDQQSDTQYLYSDVDFNSDEVTILYTFENDQLVEMIVYYYGISDKTRDELKVIFTDIATLLREDFGKPTYEKLDWGYVYQSTPPQLTSIWTDGYARRNIELDVFINTYQASLDFELIFSAF